ncbi:peptidylprolyl isomerase [Entomospira entomophila]|uniref:peptidylprolyl isomerase n=1 Tax=Entomospira entomophila TaxID=2719988 RepID=A0A968GC57_9SPIO|nr:peptidylprolyl isomerase [Entomospira entomophilus]NIZ40691.1 hypothetical protein [Entomospira entomophilus]WDI34904.1 peptidylprolyl isomerase [Entomospira entomophilus]
MTIFKKIALFAMLTTLVSSVYSQSLSTQTLVTINYLKTETISEADYKKTLKLAQTRMGRALSGEERRMILESMINDVIVMQAADRANIRVSDIDVIQKLQELGQIPAGLSLALIKEQYNSSPLAKEQSWDDMMFHMRREIAKQNYVVSQIKPREPTNAEIDKAYADHRKNFILSTRVGVSHIFFDTQGLNADDKRKKLQTAQDVHRQITSGGVTFEQAVRRYSEDPNSSQALGYLGPITDSPDARSFLGDEFMNAVFSLKPGQISQVVSTSQGYHILKITDREEEKLLTLDDRNPFNPEMSVRELVFQQLQMEYFEKDVEALLKSMREQSTININESMWDGWEKGMKNPV